jgi:hypothetical protein
VSYRLVRLNTRDHPTRELALSDMRWIIKHGCYWKQSRVPHIPRGTQMVGMGSHGGQGLFIVGVTTSDEWEDEPNGGLYKHRLPVAWAQVVYENPPVLHEIKSIPSRFNERFGADLTQQEFREIITLVLDGAGLTAPAHEEPT